MKRILILCVLVFGCATQPKSQPASLADITAPPTAYDPGPENAAAIKKILSTTVAPGRY